MYSNLPISSLFFKYSGISLSFISHSTEQTLHLSLRCVASSDCHPIIDSAKRQSGETIRQRALENRYKYNQFRQVKLKRTNRTIQTIIFAVSLHLILKTRDKLRRYIGMEVSLGKKKTVVS